MKNELSTGEWQVDPKTGQRFRTIPGGREWETVVYGTSGFMTASQLERYNAPESRAARKLKSERRAQAQTLPGYHCPFTPMNNTNCAGATCALFVDGECGVAALFPGVPTSSADGKRCPFDRHGGRCRPDCVLHCGGGCKLTTINRKDD